MCNALHHPAWCRCGWGGEGHKGRRSPLSSDENLPDPVLAERTWKSWSSGHARSDLGEPLTHPVRCTICGALIYFHTNGNGDVVFFDELGWPWPKHGCLSTESGIRRATVSEKYEQGSFERLTQLQQRPAAIPCPTEVPLDNFHPSYRWKRVRGVVMKAIKRSNLTTALGFPSGTQRIAVEIHVFVSKTTLLRVFLLTHMMPLPGEAIEVTLEPRRLKDEAVLVAKKWQFIGPNGELDSAKREIVKRDPIDEEKAAALKEQLKIERFLARLLVRAKAHNLLEERLKVSKDDTSLRIAAAKSAARKAESDGDYEQAIIHWEAAARMGCVENEVIRSLDWAKSLLSRTSRNDQEQ